MWGYRLVHLVFEPHDKAVGICLKEWWGVFRAKGALNHPPMKERLSFTKRYMAKQGKRCVTEDDLHGIYQTLFLMHALLLRLLPHHALLPRLLLRRAPLLLRPHLLLHPDWMCDCQIHA